MSGNIYALTDQSSRRSNEMGLLRRCSRLPVIAVLVAAGLAVAACSGGSAGTSSSSGQRFGWQRHLARQLRANRRRRGQHPGRQPRGNQRHAPEPAGHLQVPSGPGDGHR